MGRPHRSKSRVRPWVHGSAKGRRISVVDDDMAFQTLAPCPCARLTLLETIRHRLPTGHGTIAQFSARSSGGSRSHSASMICTWLMEGVVHKGYGRAGIDDDCTNTRPQKEDGKEVDLCQLLREDDRDDRTRFSLSDKERIAPYR
jgi:hypothetical protein